VPDIPDHHGEEDHETFEAVEVGFVSA
jgi:hypothetical protein